MSHYQRLKENRVNESHAVTIPSWRELVKMSVEDLKALAKASGIEYQGRMKTASALNKLN